jgi:iron complex transport system ATP-binding protein
MGNIWLDANHVEAWLGGRPVIHDLCLKLRIKESTTILGPNGAGKSTIVNLINRNLYPLAKPNSHLKLFDQTTINIWQLRSSLGLASSDLETRFSPQIKAKELILSGFFGSTRLGRDQIPNAQQLAKSESLLQQLNLDAFAGQPFGQLSDGQRRRLMIARALVHNPKVLVLDEPCRALDLKACHQLLDTMRKLCHQGTTLLVITHRIDTIIPEMSRILFVQQGRLVADGTPKQLLLDHKLSELFDTPLRVLEHKGYKQVLPG